MTPLELKGAYKRLLETDDGEVVLKDLEHRFHINASTYSSEVTDTAYREGQRTVVLFLKSMLQDWDPQIKEQFDE